MRSRRSLKVSHTQTSVPYGTLNSLLHFTQKFKMATKSGGKAIFCENSPVDSADTLWVQNFVEIALSRTISEINALLHFTQKFKMAANLCFCISGKNSKIQKGRHFWGEEIVFENWKE